MDAQILLLQISQGLVYLLLAPLVIGMIRRARARLQRRQGPVLLQFYRDLLKLLRKQPVTPESASWVFTAAPVTAFTCYALLGFLGPVFYLPRENASLTGDLLLLVYLLGLARLAIGLAGLDAGAPFGGLGSSRELFIHVLAEPALILIVCTLALQWQTTDLPLIIWQNRQAGPLEVYANPALLLLLLALALATLAEAGRLPFDNPATHLELTMFGKAIYLEYAGPQLALLEWAEALRLTFFLTLLANLFAPWLLAITGGVPFWNILLILLYPVKLLALALALALWESWQVKTRLRAVVTPALTALVMTLIAATLILAERYLL
jgi:formate hydrogenlyase subunit 4